MSQHQGDLVASSPLPTRAAATAAGAVRTPWDRIIEEEVLRELNNPETRLRDVQKRLSSRLTLQYQQQLHQLPQSPTPSQTSSSGVGVPERRWKRKTRTPHRIRKDSAREAEVAGSSPADPLTRGENRATADADAAAGGGGGGCGGGDLVQTGRGQNLSHVVDKLLSRIRHRMGPTEHSN